MASEGEPSDVSAMRRHLEQTLDAVDDPEVRCHVRESLQLLAVRRAERDS